MPRTRAWIACVVLSAACAASRERQPRPLPLEPQRAAAAQPPIPVSEALVGLSSGAVHVSVVPDSGGSNALVWRRLSVEGRPISPPVRLPTPARGLSRISAALDHDAVALGWCAASDEDRESFGVLFVSPDGRVVADVRGLTTGADLPIEIAPVRGCNIDVAVDPDGVLVLVRDGRFGCTDPSNEQPVRCGRVGLHRVTADGAVAQEYVGDVTTTPIERSIDLVRTSRWIVAPFERRNVMLPGTTLMMSGARPVGWQRAPGNRCRSPRCGEGVSHLGPFEGSFAWSSDVLVGLGRVDGYEGLRVWALSDRGALANVDEVRSADPPQHFPRVTAQRLVCEHDRPRVVYEIESGARFTFNPFVPGASFRWGTLLRSPARPDDAPLAAWTGSTLLVARRAGFDVLRCRAGLLVP